MKEKKVPFCPKCKISICFSKPDWKQWPAIWLTPAEDVPASQTPHHRAEVGLWYGRRQQHWRPGQQHWAMYLSPWREGCRAPDLLSQEPGFSIKWCNRQHVQSPRQRECWQWLATDQPNELQPHSTEAPLKISSQHQHKNSGSLYYCPEWSRKNRQKIYEYVDATLKVPLCKHKIPKMFLIQMNHLSQMPV